jgi:hypothetical protein
MDSDAFKLGGEQYSRLQAQLDAGQITQQQFYAAVKSISVMDTRGQTWTMGANGAWQKQGGPGNKPVAKAIPRAIGTAPARAASPGRARLAVPLLAGCLLLLCLVVIGGVALFYGPAALKLAQGLPSATVERPPTLAPSIVPVVLIPAGLTPLGGEKKQP